MIRQSTIDMLKEMRFSGMASELERQLNDTDSYRDMPFEDRRLSKSQMLQLSTCKYVEEGHHIILKGASGNGKTYIL